MADEDFAAVDLDMAVVWQRLKFAIDQLVEVVGQRDAGQLLDRSDGILAGVEEHLFIVDVDGHIAVVMAIMVVPVLLMAGTGFCNCCRHNHLFLSPFRATGKWVNDFGEGGFPLPRAAVSYS